MLFIYNSVKDHRKIFSLNILKALLGFLFSITTLGSVYATDSAPDTAISSPPIPVIESRTHPDENTWYNSRSVTFTWSLPSDVTAVRTLYDRNSISNPTKIYEPPILFKSLTTDEDGVFYMHVQFKNEDGWGVIAHRRFQIDTDKPTSITVSLIGGATTTDATPKLQVESVDPLSGIGKITIAVDDGQAREYVFDASNVYQVQTLAVGDHMLHVAAFDKAGNKIETTYHITIEKIDAPIITSYTKHVHYGDDVTISGTARPASNVEVHLVDEKGHAQLKTVSSDKNGSFSVTWSDGLSSGMYEVSARVVDKNRGSSDWTEQKMILVEEMNLLKVGIFIMNWLSLVLIIILASILVITTLWYSLTQFARFRRKVHRTMKEAEQTLKTNVQALRRDTEEFHTLLAKTQKKRELTKEETAIMKKFKKRLDITEKEIEKKLEQIG